MKKVLMLTEKVRHVTLDMEENLSALQTPLCLQTTGQFNPQFPLDSPLVLFVSAHTCLQEKNTEQRCENGERWEEEERDKRDEMVVVVGGRSGGVGGLVSAGG